MEEHFVLTVPYKGGELDLQAQLQLLGYTHRFVVWINETEMYFERDDAGDYRALLPPHVTEKEAQHISPQLLQAIAEKIQEILA